MECQNKKSEKFEFEDFNLINSHIRRPSSFGDKIEVK